MSKPKSFWQEDNDALCCVGCKKGFSFFFRRHHCRQCGFIFCSECTGQSIPVPEKGFNTPERVCKPCYVYLRMVVPKVHTSKRLSKEGVTSGDGINDVHNVFPKGSIERNAADESSFITISKLEKKEENSKIADSFEEMRGSYRRGDGKDSSVQQPQEKSHANGVVEEADNEEEQLTAPFLEFSSSGGVNNTREKVTSTKQKDIPRQEKDTPVLSMQEAAVHANSADTSPKSKEEKEECVIHQGNGAHEFTASSSPSNQLEQKEEVTLLGVQGSEHATAAELHEGEENAENEEADRMRSRNENQFEEANDIMASDNEEEEEDEEEGEGEDEEGHHFQKEWIDVGAQQIELAYFTNPLQENTDISDLVFDLGVDDLGKTFFPFPSYSQKQLVWQDIAPPRSPSLSSSSSSSSTSSIGNEKRNGSGKESHHSHKGKREKKRNNDKCRTDAEQRTHSTKHRAGLSLPISPSVFMSRIREKVHVKNVVGKPSWERMSRVKMDGCQYDVVYVEEKTSGVEVCEL